MRLRNTVLILLACISFSFSTFASEYDSLFEEYGIESEEDLKEALMTYYDIKNLIYGEDYYEAIDIYRMVKDDYGISDSDELENALYTYEYFDEAISEEGRPRLSSSQRFALEDLESEVYEQGAKDNTRDIASGIGVMIIVVFIAYAFNYDRT